MLSILSLAGFLMMAGGDVDPSSLKTFSVAGKEQSVLNGYREADLMNHRGKGCMTHMWFGGDWPGYEKTRIRVYVDGETTPSIDMESGLGHGCGFADAGAPWGSDKMGKTGHPSGLYNRFQIPFGRSIRITGQRDRQSPDGAPFWWIMRGTDNLPAMLGAVACPRRLGCGCAAWSTTPRIRSRSLPFAMKKRPAPSTWSPLQPKGLKAGNIRFSRR